MRIEWLSKKNTDRVIVFFNGWGMSGQAVKHLQTKADVVMFYDYRSLEMEQFPDFKNYQEIYLIAWSMGVWAATQLISRLNIKPQKLIALNGTERPVDDQYGIPARIYELTEKGMNERGREKFILRMLDSRDEKDRWRNNLPERSLAEVCEELCLVRKQSPGVKNESKWDVVYISEKDVIFPVTNQQNWWQGRGAEIRKLSGGHYPFYQFGTWEEIIEGNYKE